MIALFVIAYVIAFCSAIHTLGNKKSDEFSKFIAVGILGVSTLLLIIVIDTLL